MKFLLPIIILVTLFACKKEKEKVDNKKATPHLTFTQENKKWFIYFPGQDWKFKNDKGDSMVYKVMLIEQNFLQPEFRDTTSTIIAYTQSYKVTLKSADDSIVVYFYKEYQSNDPDKLRCNILWTSMKGQLLNLAAIENNASFNQKTVSGLTYTTVTPAVPSSDMVDPFTRFDKAWYDQGAGFIEIIDMNGVSWKRV
ncbi:MAG: hypothetical protein ACJ751_18350 [Niastella sp.]|uniref:hypothetical protein n=1 Tax=Niastella sp. TaxID=1869183 RepID=UPI003899F17E